MARSRKQPEFSIPSTPGVQAGVTAEMDPENRGLVMPMPAADHAATAIEPKQAINTTADDELDRQAKDLLRTIAIAQSTLLTAYEEFVPVFAKIFARSPQRRTTRSKKKVSVEQDIYEWSEEAEKQTGAQIHWIGLLKQIKARKMQRMTDS